MSREQKINRLLMTLLFYSFFLMFQKLTAELLANNDVNVITVDWGFGSSPPYTQAVANIRLVGTITALLINTMSVSFI